MITTRHTLDDARIIHKEALSLANAGHEVCLLYSCNDRYEYLRNDGKLIVKGEAPHGKTTYRGLNVYGLPKRNGLIGKVKMCLELGKLAAKLNADVYHAHEPDLSLVIAIRAKKILAKHGFKSLVVHDMHEYPPGEPADKGPKFFKSVILYSFILWDKLLVRNVDHVFTANNIVRGYILSLQYKLSVDVLFNGPILKLFPQPAFKTWPRNEEKLLLCHEGSLPFDRGLKEMIQAVNHLRDRVCLRIVGDVFGEERTWLMKEIEDKGLHDNITITGWLPYEKVSEAVNSCHVGLILFRDCIENRLAGPPNKLFNYMNSGLPVLSVDFPEMRQIIQEEECGMLIRDQSIEAITESIEALLLNIEVLERMSKNGQKAINERYAWEVIEKKLISSYERFAKQLSN